MNSFLEDVAHDLKKAASWAGKYLLPVLGVAEDVATGGVKSEFSVVAGILGTVENTVTAEETAANPAAKIQAALPGVMALLQDGLLKDKTILNQTAVQQGAEGIIQGVQQIMANSK